MTHKFSVNGVEVTVPDCVATAVCAMALVVAGNCRASLRVEAIKLVRTAGLGLYEAKHIVDYMWDNFSLSEEGVVCAVTKLVSYHGRTDY
jgi:ribosomal protein L7/L12